MYDPGTVGVPDSKPALDKVSPGGRLDPFLTTYETPFVAAKLTDVMDDPVSTSDKPTLVVHSGKGTVIKVNARSANTTGEVVLRARTVKLYAADAVGVPDRIPAELIKIPAGSAPDVTVKPVALAFVATRLEVYVTPWLVFARDDAVVQFGKLAMIQVNVRSAMASGEVPTAVIVKLYDPATVGVPVKAPPTDSAIPVGSVEPLLTTYDDAFPADRLMVVMAADNATAPKSAPVAHKGVVDAST